MDPPHSSFSMPVRETRTMESLPRCALCQNGYFPEKKNRNHQLYCSLTCRILAKKEQDKRHNEVYRKTEKYRAVKRDQNRRYRKKKGWEEYMRQYREGHPEKVREQNRKASKKYYQRNKRKIAFRRSDLRWQKRLRAEIEALKKASS